VNLQSDEQADDDQCERKGTEGASPDRQVSPRLLSLRRTAGEWRGTSRPSTPGRRRGFNAGSLRPHHSADHRHRARRSSYVSQDRCGGHTVPVLGLGLPFLFSFALIVSACSSIEGSRDARVRRSSQDRHRRSHAYVTVLRTGLARCWLASGVSSASELPLRIHRLLSRTGRAALKLPPRHSRRNPHRLRGDDRDHHLDLRTLRQSWPRPVIILGRSCLRLRIPVLLAHRQLPSAPLIWIGMAVVLALERGYGAPGTDARRTIHHGAFGTAVHRWATSSDRLRGGFSP